MPTLKEIGLGFIYQALIKTIGTYTLDRLPPMFKVIEADFTFQDEEDAQYYTLPYVTLYIHGAIAAKRKIRSRPTLIPVAAIYKNHPCLKTEYESLSLINALLRTSKGTPIVYLLEYRHLFTEETQKFLINTLIDVEWKAMEELLGHPLPVGISQACDMFGHGLMFDTSCCTAEEVNLVKLLCKNTFVNGTHSIVMNQTPQGMIPIYEDQARRNVRSLLVVNQVLADNIPAEFRRVRYNANDVYIPLFFNRHLFDMEEQQEFILQYISHHYKGKLITPA